MTNHESTTNYTLVICITVDSFYGGYNWDITTKQGKDK